MSFASPFGLLALLTVPLLGGLYWAHLRRRRKRAVRFSNVALLRGLVPRRSAWRRHVPVALLLGALAFLGVAAARPQANVTVPYGRTSIILALDVSRSMCATDVDPNRLSVAQDAARTFVEDQPKGTRIGLVAFSSFAETIVEPTTDREALLAAIDVLSTARGTAIGAAMMKAIDAIAAVNPDVAPVDVEPPGAGTVPSDGTYVPDIVVVLTDGANTRGIEPIDAVPFAVTRRVRVYTIGFGTTEPGGMACTREQLGGDVFNPEGGGFGGGGFGGGGGGGGGRRRFLVIDEPTLQTVAERTGAEYYRAEDAEQLQKVFSGLPRDVELQSEQQEIAVWFAVAALLSLAAAVVFSLRWNPPT